jgi:O-antigen ligase
MPENFAFNSDEGLSRRLISTFLSPLASAFAVAVALLLVAAGGPLRRPLGWGLAAVAGAGLLFTFSRSTVLALAGGLIVLAVARRRAWPVAAAGATVIAGLAFALVFTSVAPATHFFPDELEEQERIAREKGDVPSGELSLAEPSIRSHLASLRDDVRDVLEHPQGYGLGNAGAVARRTDTELKAGESNYTELGIETGLAGALLFIAWSVAILIGLVRAAWRGDAERRWAAAGLAAAFATVLALGVQTDAFGVPWLAYCLWWLSGSLVDPAPSPATAAATTRWSSATENGLIR